jgi:hypothetical protein
MQETEMRLSVFRKTTFGQKQLTTDYRLPATANFPLTLRKFDCAIGETFRPEPPMKLTLLLLGSITLAFAAAVPARAADTKVYELRIYTTNPGKLDALLARFRDHTCKLFEKHGIENIGYWVPLDKEQGAENKLIYIIAHKSREAAKASWSAFGQDPDWRAAAKKSEEGGRILSGAPVSIYMTETDYSKGFKPGSGGSRVFELRDYTTPDSKVAALHSRFRDHTVKLFEKHGMTNVAYWEPTDKDKGAGSRLIYLLAHASKEAADKSWAAFRADPVWVAAKKASEEKAGGSLTVTDGVKSTFMKATDFSPTK